MNRADRFLVSAWLLAVAAAGCGSTEEARVVVEGGPVIVVSEGGERLSSVRIEPAPSALVTATDVSIDAPPEVLALFERLDIVGQPGALQLAIEPRCDVVAPGAGDAVIDVEIASANAATALVTIQIPEADPTACAPRVIAWTGSCDSPPVDGSSTIDVPPGTPHVCFAVDNRDQVHDRLWVRAQTDAPSSLIEPAGLPVADDVVSVATATVALGDTTNVRGQFQINYQVYRADPESGAPAIPDDQVTLNVGSGGTSVEIVSAPASIPEFDSGSVEFRVWHRDDTDPFASTCARVAYPDPPAGVDGRRGRATLRLYEGLDASADQDEWLCGSSFRFAFSPTIDAATAETVRIDAATCVCSGGAVAPLSSVESRDVSLAVNSLAESLPCDATFNIGDPIQVVCADLDADGDDTPDIVVRTLDRLCVYGGADGRSFELAATTQPAGGGVSELHSFVRVTTTGSAPVIIGSERTGGTTRIVQLVTSGGAPSWQPFAPLANVTAVMRHLAPMSPAAGGPATYVARVIPTASGRGLRLSCVDEDACCTGPGTCDAVDIDFADFGVAETVAGVVAADTNGNGRDELVFFTFDEGTGTKRLHARIVDVTWTAGAPIPAAGPYTRLGGITATGSRINGAAINDLSCMGAGCAQNVYAAAVDGGIGDAVLFVLIGGPSPTMLTVQTPGIAYDVAGIGGLLVTGLDFGLYTSALATAGGFGGWRLQDPVLRELAGEGMIGAPIPGYGSSVARCNTAGSEASVAIAVTWGQVRYTRLNIDVVAP